MAWVNGVSDLGGGGAGGAVTDPIVPADGTQNITGALAVSGAITAASLASSGAVSGTTITGSSHISGVNVSSSGAILAAVGTVGAPGISWTTYPATGFYVPSANVVTLALNGVASMTWATGVSAFRQSIGTGTSSGFNVSNTTAAAAGAQQYSPSLRLAGTGWATDSGGSSKTCAWYLQTRTIEGAAAPTAELHVMQLIDAGTPTSMANFSTLGGLTISGGLTAAAASTTTINSIGTAATAGHTLINTTAASAGAQQYSPALYWQGSGWKTDATAASQTVAFLSRVRPIQGAAAPTGVIEFMSSINGGAATSVFTCTSLGSFTVANTLTTASTLTVSSGGAAITGTITGSSTITSTVGTATTAATVNVWFCRADSTGTAAAGFGPGLVFQADNASGTASQDVARISGNWTTATASSETSVVNFDLRNAGGALGNVFKIQPSGTTKTASGTASIASTHTTDTLGLSITTGGSATAGSTLGYSNNVSTVIAATGTNHGLTLTAPGAIAFGTGSTLSMFVDPDTTVYFFRRMLLVKGTDTASATNVDLPYNGNTVLITGTTTIQSISSTGWAHGSRVRLVFNGALTLKHNGSVTGNYRAVSTSTGLDVTTAAGSTLELTLFVGSTTYWIATPLSSNPQL